LGVKTRRTQKTEKMRKGPRKKGSESFENPAGSEPRSGGENSPRK